MNKPNYLRYWNTIKKYKYISFDIFDTLIKRNVQKPTDVFELVESQYNSLHGDKIVIGFRENRHNAEIKAREQSKSEEVSLDEIYSYLAYPKEIQVDLKNIEIEIEERVCVPNLPMRKLYKKCISNGKKVIITSDMYLPANVVREILADCGYDGFYKLYLSSTVKYQKTTGNLYKYFLKDLNVNPQNVIHIGDSKRADFLAAIKCGIHSILISRHIKNTSFIDSELLNINPYIFINNILPKYENSPEMFQWGYEAYGPLILGFCEWIHYKYKSKKIEQMYFLARDMNIMLEVYKKMYPSDKVKYLEVSRRSLRVAYILKQGSIKAVYDTMARVNYSVRQVCDSVGVDTDIVLKNSLLEKSISPDDEFPKDDTKEFKALDSSIIELLNSRDDQAIYYLQYMGMYGDNNIAIVDIGWHGTIQNMLEVILKRRLSGFYFGSTVRNYFDKMNTCGYWFDAEDEYSILPKLTMISVLEVMLFPKIGTTVGYKRNGEAVVPEYGPCEMDDSFKLVKQFQDGGLQFVKDYNRTILRSKKYLDSKVAVAAYEKLAFQPTLEEANIIGDLPYEEGRVLKLAGRNKTRAYLANPKNFIKDYQQAKWKTGFLKRVAPFIRDPHALDSVIKNRNIK